jgi:hypothetical protein
MNPDMDKAERRLAAAEVLFYVLLFAAVVWTWA